jgi:LysM repeat protein
MTAKRAFQLFVAVAILAASFGSAGSALAGGNCASYITVQWGDTLSGIAAYCGTSVEAIQAANPGIGWWLFAGQVLYIPTGYASAPAPAPVYQPQNCATYTIQWGDTLGSVAARMGFSLSDVLAVNPQIWNASLIYPGQVINLPASASVPPPAAYVPPPAYSPAPVDSSPQYSVLRVTYGSGLLVRTGPGKEYPIIDSALVSAVYGSNWRYRKNSTTVDSKGFTWVEITFAKPVNGATTGWIIVKDTLDSYFTKPQINFR